MAGALKVQEGDGQQVEQISRQDAKVVRTVSALADAHAPDSRMRSGERAVAELQHRGDEEDADGRCDAEVIVYSIRQLEPWREVRQRRRARTGGEEDGEERRLVEPANGRLPGQSVSARSRCTSSVLLYGAIANG